MYTYYDYRIVARLAEAARAVYPGDAAWRSFAHKLAIAWYSAFVVTGRRTPTGIEKPLTRTDRITNHAAWRALANVAEDWPGQPLGMTETAVFLFFSDALKADQREVPA